MNSNQHHWRYYLIATGLCLVALSLEFRLWRADFHVPFYYDEGDDVDENLRRFKAFRDSGWILTDSWLGAPGIQESHDVTQGDNLPHVIGWLISALTPDVGTAINLTFLSFFLLTTWAALYAMRRLDIPGPIAVVLSLLFSFQPYAFMRGQRHLALTCYFPVPLMILVAVWLCDSTPIFSIVDDRGKVRARWLRGRTLPALVATVLIGSDGAYYAFFGAGCVAVAALVVLLRTRKPARLVDHLIAASLISVVLAIHLAPKVWYDLAHGSNPGVIVRSPYDSLVGSLNISAMIKPVPYHGLKSIALALLGRSRPVPPVWDYGNAYSPRNVQSIGLVAACGFLLLILAVFSERRPRGTLRLVRPLSRLNLAFVLVGTTGGFGYLFALLVTPKIRGWDRLNIFIAFVSLSAIGLLLKQIQETRSRTPAERTLFGAALAALLVFGMIDQMPQARMPTYEHAREEYDRDRDFVRAIENALPEQAMVFQLPWLAYPEEIATHGSWAFNGYAHLRPYVHSTQIRWSHGAMRGREVAAWQQRIAEEPLSQMVADLEAASFRGIYVDRRGYHDGADVPVVDGLKKLLGVEPIADSRGERLLFVLPAARPGPAR
jgi:phosphoglycerol transferase